MQHGQAMAMQLAYIQRSSCDRMLLPETQMVPQSTTRYDKRDDVFLACVLLAAIAILLKRYDVSVFFKQALKKQHETLSCCFFLLLIDQLL